MKKISILSVICLLAFHAIAQQKVTISGKLLNCTDRKLEIVPSTGNFKDSIKVNPDGTFNYTTTAIQSPFKANLTNRKQIQIQLFLAPGYDLQITADVKDYKVAKSTLNYEGLGSKTNSYWKEVMSTSTPDTVKWVQKDEDTYLANLMRTDRLTARINKAFTADNREPYANYFKESLLLDQKFGPLLSIFNSYAYEHNYSWDQIQKMIGKTGYKPLLEEFKDERNLASSLFSYLLTQYPFYCDNYNAFPADSVLKKQSNYSLILASRWYAGKIYDYYASNEIESKLTSLYKLEDFKKLAPYIQKIGDQKLRTSVKAIEAERIRKAMSLQKGAPSPLFNLTDTSGKYYQLAAMKGKVVYIDLWASWCGPCKEETPYLKKIYEQLKNNDKVKIISIASFDAKNRRRRHDIIKKDGMDWLQLEDTDDSFAKSYQANFIPRFIIIDKQGKIVDSDAVRPSDPEKLMTILNREINK
ncbi:MAG TPA: TlpA disulfide reductase family protein [Pedobacter sp.]|nr:TlpA disulfide reductase family protein [Pedobacter sp.]